MPPALIETILSLAGLLDDLDRRRVARALTHPAPEFDDEAAYELLVRACADLDEHAAALISLHTLGRP